jgi:vacuolar-type H+-ATPase subunit I/STV1
MPRHPNQNAALDRHHKDRKDQTRQALLDAMDRLLRGEPLFTDGELTEANLYREAKRSRATLNRYPEIKHKFSEAKGRRRESSASDKDERIRELEEAIRQLQREERRTIRELRESRDRLAQEVYVLNLFIEQMKKKNNQTPKRSIGIVQRMS